MKRVPGGVTAAKGFVAAGVSAGIKRSRKPDMALVVSETPAMAGGTLTTNLVKAAPVVISRRRLAAGSARAVFLNSGCANCMTGEAGYADALTLSRDVAHGLRVAEREVLIASTGIIGRRLPLPRMRRVIPRLIQHLSRAHHHEAALAILTTDLLAKEVAIECGAGQHRWRLGGMAKGAGMIAPSMATMLCVLTTDAQVDRGFAANALREAVARSFNRVSVDGDMSTNDSVFLLANGRSGVRIRRGSREARGFIDAVNQVTQLLAYLLVKDGEGATRVARIRVRGAKTASHAHACARQVATSSLVRTMLASGDPNVGRIAAATGASGASFDPARLQIHINGVTVVSGGVAHRLGKTVAKTLLAPKEVEIDIDLQAGRHATSMLACDLTQQYVRINAFYTT